MEWFIKRRGRRVALSVCPATAYNCYVTASSRFALCTVVVGLSVGLLCYVGYGFCFCRWLCLGCLLHWVYTCSWRLPSLLRLFWGRCLYLAFVIVPGGLHLAVQRGSWQHNESHTLTRESCLPLRLPKVTPLVASPLPLHYTPAFILLLSLPPFSSLSSWVRTGV